MKVAAKIMSAQSLAVRICFFLNVAKVIGRNPRAFIDSVIHYMNNLKMNTVWIDFETNVTVISSSEFISTDLNEFI